MYRVTQDGWISASHQLRRDDGTMEPIHGHNWRIQVAVDAVELDELGRVVDLVRLKAVVLEVLDGLDHVHLNELAAFDQRPASAEAVARHVFDTLAPILDDPRSHVAEVRVWMTDEQMAGYRR